MIKPARVLLLLLAVAAAATTSACASITSGTTQSINVNSNPDEADCTLTREGKDIATVKTPGPVKISRESRSIRVVCRKEGYNAGEAALDAQMESAFFGNLILGGVVGLAVDAASGAYQRYPAFVMVALTPLSGVQPPPPTMATPAARPVPAPAPTAVALPAAPAAPRATPVVATEGEAPAPVAPAAPIAPASGMSRSRL